MKSTRFSARRNALASHDESIPAVGNQRLTRPHSADAGSQIELGMTECDAPRRGAARADALGKSLLKGHASINRCSSPDLHFRALPFESARQVRDRCILSAVLDASPTNDDVSLRRQALSPVTLRRCWTKCAIAVRDPANRALPIIDHRRFWWICLARRCAFG